MREKINHVRQERANDVIVEGDRRRFSMMVEGILDSDLYLAALSDFIVTVTSTMEIAFRKGDLRNPNPNNINTLRIFPMNEVLISFLQYSLCT